MKGAAQLTPQTPDYSTGDFYSANLVGFSADGGLGEMSLSSDGHVYCYSSDESYLFEQPVNLGQYYRLALDYDFAANTTTYRLNGHVLGTKPMNDSFTSDVLSRGSLVVYALGPDSLNRDRTEYSAYYDNFSIVTIPEPATFALAALGFIGSTCSRRRSVRRDASY